MPTRNGPRSKQSGSSYHIFHVFIKKDLSSAHRKQPGSTPWLYCFADRSKAGQLTACPRYSTHVFQATIFPYILVSCNCLFLFRSLGLLLRVPFGLLLTAFWGSFWVLVGFLWFFRGSFGSIRFANPNALCFYVQVSVFLVSEHYSAKTRVSSNSLKQKLRV